eukprot:4737212-Prymnesium_polylepis.1
MSMSMPMFMPYACVALMWRTPPCYGRCGRDDGPRPARPQAQVLQRLLPLVPARESRLALTPSTLNPQPSILNPQSLTLTLNAHTQRSPSTLTRNPQPSTLTPSTLNPQPSTLSPHPQP